LANVTMVRRTSEACPPHCARRPRRSSFSSPPAASDRLLLQAQFVRGMFVAGATVTLFRPGAEVPFQWERETPGRDAKARPSPGLDGLCRRLPRRPARVEHGARRVPHPRHQAQGSALQSPVGALFPFCLLVQYPRSHPIPFYSGGGRAQRRRKLKASSKAPRRWAGARVAATASYPAALPLQPQ
jgi:hypothetical protein